MAIILDNLAIAEAILTHPDVKPNLPNKYDVLPLMLATSRMTDLLLSHPKVWTDVKGVERSFRVACKEGKLELVRVYLACGELNINAHNEVCGNPYTLAVSVLCFKKCAALYFEEDGVTALMLAACYNFPLVVEALFNRPDLDVNMQTFDGYTTLTRACCGAKELPHIVQLLLSHPKLNINLRQQNGSTALAYACVAGRKKSVALLLANPTIDVNLPD
eukprot:CAMPEP_0184992580 /NCGR_PEP_ID=MMETSP1098-20130426/41829_1 /TAXON_ID=89044 /ORGANISM="Spumella elongata, Strain CCAP 955/1" /LENGTH=217 /DNA_ID=CAMNT_0027518225 /DNA_START=36 /DNA_END=688 /DNA_ORIENTATION=+